MDTLLNELIHLRVAVIKLPGTHERYALFGVA